MNKYLKIFFLLLCLVESLAIGQVLENNGGFINAEPGSFIYINGSVLNGTNGVLDVDGTISSQAELYVTEDITNDAALIVNGHVRLLGNWFNNLGFDSNLGTVFFEGGNQLISGTSESHFFNITLDGSGLKTQEINAFSEGILDLKHLELQTETYSFNVENEDLNSIIRTSGFVSSLNGGFLSRKTNQVDHYLFPVGSSQGVLRYRPVEIKPLDISSNTFTARLANLDATLEGYDRSLYDTSTCNLNPLYYHQINRTVGISSVDLNIYFDELADGSWGGISNWKQVNGQWENIPGSASMPGNPLSIAFTNDWNTFTDIPYILNHINEIPVFDPIGPICQNTTAPILPSVSLNGYTGTWSGTIDSSITGIQTFTFTPDPNQCSFTAQINVEVYELPQVVSINGVDDILCYGDSAVVNVIASGNGNIGYQIDNSTYSSNNQFNLPSGTYEFGIIDENGCMNSEVSVLTEPDSIQVLSDIQNVLCPNGTGSVDIDISGGVGSYDVVWNNTIFSEDLTSIVAGFYQALITDDNGCEQTHISVVIETLSAEPSYIENTTGSDTLNCNVNLVSVEAFGGSNYIWSGGLTPNSSVNEFNLAGSYTVSYIDSNDCPLQMDITIFEDYSLPNISIVNNTNSSDELNCIHPTIQLNAEGGVSYIWDNSLGTSNSIMINTAGIYEVTGVGPNGCENMASFVITEDFIIPNVEILNLTGTDTIDCNNDSIQLEAYGGAITYEWINGPVVGTNYTVDSEAMYYVEGTGVNGCTGIDSIFIYYLPNPTLSVNSATICSGDSIVLIAQTDQSGGVYTWSSGLGNDSTITVSPNSNDFYTVDYEGPNQCPSNTAFSTVSVLPTPVGSISGDDLICSGQPAVLSGNGSLPGGNCEWYPSNDTSADITVYPMIDTDYQMVYTVNGCPSDTVFFSVEVITTPTIDVSDVSICEGDVGTLTAYPSESGGTFKWFPGGFTTSSITISSDTNVTYNVSYTLNGCTSEIQSAELIVNEIPSIVLDDIGICNGDSGILTAVASTPGGVYTWSGFTETTASLEVNPTVTSSYTVVYELNNCTSQPVSAVVTVTDQPFINVSDIGLCIGETVSITAVPSEPGGIINWTPGDYDTETITITPTEDIEYIVNYNLNGCLAEAQTVSVTVDTVPAVTFDVSATSGCAPMNVVFTNTTDNAFDCVWDIDGITTMNECSGFSFTFWNEGCYDINLSMGTPNGCIASMTMEDIICVLPNPNVDFSVSTSQVSFGSSEVDFNNNSTNAVDYIWDYGDGTTDSLVFYPGPHEFDIDDEEFFPVTLYGISEFGCIDSLQLMIFVDHDAVIFAPNSFTPDNDGLNDTWFPTYSTSIDENYFEVQIYNRWGEMIFEAKDFSNTWDGTYKGTACQVGTYSYRILYKRKYSEERHHVLGHISLIR
jgi:gliding motility-associated-like protein